MCGAGFRAGQELTTAVEGLAVTDREAQDQDFALLVGVSSQAFIVTLHTQKKMGEISKS